MSVDLERIAFEQAGIPTGDLTDEQVHEASERIVERFGGITPDLQELAIVVDSVRFEKRLRLVAQYDEQEHQR